MFTGLARGRPRFLKGRALSRLPFLAVDGAAGAAAAGVGVAGVVGVAGAEN